MDTKTIHADISENFKKIISPCGAKGSPENKFVYYKYFNDFQVKSNLMMSEIKCTVCAEYCKRK